MTTPRLPSAAGRGPGRLAHRHDRGPAGAGGGPEPAAPGSATPQGQAAATDSAADPGPDAVADVAVAVYVDGSAVDWRDDDPGTGASAADLARALQRARAGGGFVWVSAHDPDPADIAVVGRALDLSPKTSAEAAHGTGEAAQGQDPADRHLLARPRLTVIGDHLVLVATSCRYIDHPEETATAEIEGTGHIVVVADRDWVLTVRRGPTPELSELAETLAGRPKLLTLGPGAVLDAVLDAMITSYNEVSDEVQVDIDELEVVVFSGERPPPVDKAYRMKRQLAELRAAVNPLITPLARMADLQVPAVTEPLRPVLADLADHLDRVRDAVAGLDGLLDSITDACRAQITMAQNDDSRRISAWVAIAAVPTAVAGIYGMNFEHMPELTWRYGYPLVLLVILIACVSLYVNFKHRHWL